MCHVVKRQIRERDVFLHFSCQRSCDTDSPQCFCHSLFKKLAERLLKHTQSLSTTSVYETLTLQLAVSAHIAVGNLANDSSPAECRVALGLCVQHGLGDVLAIRCASVNGRIESTGHTCRKVATSELASSL
eukprot:2010474-Amphidinium_carterae.2